MPSRLTQIVEEFEPHLNQRDVEFLEALIVWCVVRKLPRERRKAFMDYARRQREPKPEGARLVAVFHYITQVGGDCGNDSHIRR